MEWKISMTDDTCIYCQKVVDVRRGQGDHVIPAALGRFEGEFIFRRICRDCNSLIGKCEEQLLRCAPEAFLRRIVQPTVKRNNRGTSWVGANGMPAPRFTIDHGDHHELGEASSNDPRNVLAIDQLVIVDK
jgi:HNH endonuclease